MTDSKVKAVVVFKDDKHLAELIKGFAGYSMATLDLTTVCKCTVKSRKNKEIKYGDVFEGTLMCSKHQYIGIGYEYRKSLNNRLEKQGEQAVETGELPWGQWHEGSKIVIEHKGNFYLRITYLNANEKYSSKIYHYENGDEITDEANLIKDDFLPLKKDTVLIVNSVKFAGIVRVVFDGKIFIRKGYLTAEDKGKLNLWREAATRNDKEALETEAETAKEF